MKRIHKKNQKKKSRQTQKVLSSVTGNGFVSLIRRRLVDPTAATRCGVTRRDEIK